MDLVYTDRDYRHIGVLENIHGDFEISHDKNDFEIKISAAEYLEAKNKGLAGSCLLYAPYTEIGGILDTIKLNDGIISLCGRTWGGKLQETIIRPKNEDYVKITGTPSEIVAAIISRCGLGSFFAVNAVPGDRLTFQFDRYTDVWAGLQKMCRKIGKRLKITREHDMCHITVVDRITYMNDVRENAQRPRISQNHTVLNHLICLGQGELQQRTVVDLYADKNGKVSQTQTIFGDDERTTIYDFTSAEREQLIEDGTKRLKEYQEFSEADIPIMDDRIMLGDYISAAEPITGITVLAEITDIIYRIDGETVEPRYRTGVVKFSNERIL